MALILADRALVFKLFYVMKKITPKITTFGFFLIIITAPIAHIASSFGSYCNNFLLFHSSFLFSNSKINDFDFIRVIFQAIDSSKKRYLHYNHSAALYTKWVCVVFYNSEYIHYIAIMCVVLYSLSVIMQYLTSKLFFILFFKRNFTVKD